MERFGNHQWRSREVARLLSLLEAERRYYEDILMLLPYPIAIVQADGFLSSANRAFLQHFSLRSAEAAGYPVARLLPSLKLTAGEHEGWSLLPAERWDDDGADLILVQQAGAAVPESTAATAEMAENSAATAVSGRLAGRVLHEVNNLLMVLSGYGAEIRDALPPGSPLREDMREVLRSTDRLQGLSGELQALASPPRAILTTFDLGPLLPDLLAQPCFVTADRPQIDQALRALRPKQASFVNGRLTLGGLPETLREDLDPLRALSAVPQLLAQSKIGWRVTGPGTMELQFAAGVEPPLAPPRILVVDDEEGIRSLVKKVLERSGFQVVDAPSAESALAMMDRDPAPVDLLITDMMMPGMNGRTLSTQLSQARPGTRTLFMSGYTEDAEVQSGRLQTGTAFLAKPFQHAALIEAVNRLLAQ